ncbi:hypothetical protein NVP1284A_24 [Vibrio phage 1.284.A._10N.286.55.A5]|nr:hypothetical protein NVP1284A_24 [Vibrio phage 1.284.A._10N.286.55.A5]
MEIYEGDEVMIMTGKLMSFYGHVVSIERYQNKPDKALVRTLDENNEPTRRRYNLSNLLKS